MKSAYVHNIGVTHRFFGVKSGAAFLNIRLQIRGSRFRSRYSGTKETKNKLQKKELKVSRTQVTRERLNDETL